MLTARKHKANGKSGGSEAHAHSGPLDLGSVTHSNLETARTKRVKLGGRGANYNN